MTQADWRFEPFWEQIIRGGVIPTSAGKGFERHRGRTILLAIGDFERWLTVEITTWPEASGEELCYRWLVREMRVSPNDKSKIKAKWLEEARGRFQVTGREFERAWSKAIKETGSNWDKPGAPMNPRSESPH